MSCRQPSVSQIACKTRPSGRTVSLARQAKAPIGKKPMAAYCSCRDAFLPGPSSRLRQSLRPRAFIVSHLGSVMPAVCLTRPQYVLRSYCDSGSSRLPGMEADMLAWVLEARKFVSFLLLPCASGRSQWQGSLVLGNGRREERRRVVCGGLDQLRQLRHRHPLEVVIRRCSRQVAQPVECVGGVRPDQAVANRSSHRPGGGFQSWILRRVLIAELGPISRGLPLCITRRGAPPTTPAAGRTRQGNDRRGEEVAAQVLK